MCCSQVVTFPCCETNTSLRGAPMHILDSGLKHDESDWKNDWYKKDLVSVYDNWIWPSFDERLWTFDMSKAWQGGLFPSMTPTLRLLFNLEIRRLFFLNWTLQTWRILIVGVQETHHVDSPIVACMNQRAPLWLEGERKFGGEYFQQVFKKIGTRWDPICCKWSYNLYNWPKINE